MLTFKGCFHQWCDPIAFFVIIPEVSCPNFGVKVCWSRKAFGRNPSFPTSENILGRISVDLWKILSELSFQVILFYAFVRWLFTSHQISFFNKGEFSYYICFDIILIMCMCPGMHPFPLGYQTFLYIIVVLCYNSFNVCDVSCNVHFHFWCHLFGYPNGLFLKIYLAS